MNLFQKIAYEKLQNATRRHFLRDVGCGMGALWFGLHGSAGASTPTTTGTGRPGLPHFTPKTKRIIYLHMVGAPSQLDLFDYKPQLAKFDGKDCPQAYLEGQRFAFIQGTPKLLGPQFDFRPVAPEPGFPTASPISPSTPTISVSSKHSTPTSSITAPPKSSCTPAPPGSAPPPRRLVHVGTRL